MLVTPLPTACEPSRPVLAKAKASTLAMLVGMEIAVSLLSL